MRNPDLKPYLRASLGALLLALSLTAAAQAAPDGVGRGAAAMPTEKPLPPAPVRLEGVELDAVPLIAPPSVPGIEHVRFERRPINAVVEIGRERMVHFPYAVAIHKPEQTDGPLTVDIVGSTAYLNAQAPMAPLRLVAEGLNGEGMIPINVVVRGEARSVPDELEIILADFAKSGASGTGSGKKGDAGDEAPASPDLVALSRYCSQMLYAPQRLIKPLPGVRQTAVRQSPVANLYRGGALMTTPIGAWQAGPLHVTAVRFTNRTEHAVELDMDQLRGHWVAATPQHWRLLPRGNEADTTAVCLISEQAFDVVRP
jgi:integrating conjugative element protein (TIGR03749 family)